MASSAKATKVKRPKQTNALSAIINSPRQNKITTVAASLKKSTEDAAAGGTLLQKSERKQAGSYNLKEKLKTLKTGGKIDPVLSVSAQK